MDLKLKYTKLTLLEFILLISVVLFLLSNCLSGFIGLSYLDELFAILILFLSIIKAKNLVFPKYVVYSFSCMIFMLVLGITCNLNTKLVNSFFPILIDAFGLFKNHIVFIGIIFLMPKIDYDKILKILFIIAKIFISIVFVCGIINFFFDIGMSYTLFSKFRFGLRSYQFLYTNPAMVGIVMVVCIGILDYNHYNGFYKVMAIISMALTLRIVVISCIVVYFLLDFITKFTERLKFKHLLIIGICVLITGWWGISTYFLSGNTIRSLLLKNGIIIFKRYFPFGAGFATYGGQMAIDYYSPLYREFGYNHIWGLSQGNSLIANDNFWPMIMAQLGFFGTISMLLLLYLEFDIINSSTSDKQIKKGQFLIFFSLIIGSTASADLTGVAGMIRYIPLAIITASNYLFITQRENINEKINSK